MTKEETYSHLQELTQMQCWSKGIKTIRGRSRGGGRMESRRKSMGISGGGARTGGGEVKKLPREI